MCVNLILVDDPPHLQWLDLDAARAHCAAGASIWAWASNVPDGEEPDIILAAAGDAATLETVAAAGWLRKHAPELKVRVVNVVDLMALFSPTEHPCGFTHGRFADLFTENTHVIFAFHGYPGLVHEMLHGRPQAQRFHVRGFREEGTTTTPFDMVVRNGTSRYHLAMEAGHSTSKTSSYTVATRTLRYAWTSNVLSGDRL
jgi:xylulose-5-phosphate/fructose-6-phosphate phosphoketolase